MKQLAYSILFLSIVTSCGQSKQAVSGKKSSSAYDSRYIGLFHSGVRYKVKGQIKDAIAVFDSCFQIRPNDDAVAYALATCYQQQNEIQKATEYTEKASKLDPENAWYTQELAYMYFGQGKFEASEKCFEKLIEKEPRNIDFLYGRAEILKKLNRQQEAITMYDRMEDQIGIIPDITIQKFDLYRSLNQDAKGIEEVNKARKTHPDDLSLIGVLVDYYFSKNQISKAQEMLTELTKADPSNERANLALGDLLYREFKKDEAYKHFLIAFQGTGLDLNTKMQVMLELYNQQAVIEEPLVQMAQLLIDNYPEDAKAYSIMGDLLLKKNEPIPALQSYQKALQFENNNYALWNQVLVMEYELLKFEDLYRDARACSALYPSQPGVQLFYTIACNQLDRYQEAIDAADIGKELVVNDPETEAEFYAQKGQAYFELTNYSKGIESYEQALKISPKNNLVKNNYAMHLAMAGLQLNQAEKLINEALNEVPENPAFLDTKGYILFQKGAYDEALMLFLTCADRNPQEAGYQDHTGDAYFKLGNVSKAIESWKKALALGSKNKVLNKKIETKTYVEAQF